MSGISHPPWLAHRPRITSKPFRIWVSWFGLSLPTRSVKHSRSSEVSWERLATESLGLPIVTPPLPLGSASFRSLSKLPAN